MRAAKPMTHAAGLGRSHLINALSRASKRVATAT
jgi:hypothetical protein